jgi:hypothetical protein
MGWMLVLQEHQVSYLWSWSRSMLIHPVRPAADQTRNIHRSRLLVSVNATRSVAPAHCNPGFSN